MCVGLNVVEVAPSPKLHKCEMVPEDMVDVFVNTKLLPVRHWVLALIVNDTTGLGLTVMVLLILSLHPLFEEVTRTIVNGPAVE